MARRQARPEAAGTVLRRLRGQLRNGWPPGLTLLSGDDLYHLDAAQRELLSALVPEGDSDFGLTVYGSERIDVSIVIAAVRSAGMFARRRVVLVRDLDSLEGEPGPLEEYAADPPPQSYLLVRARGLDQRRKLHKTLAKAGLWFAFVRPDEIDPMALAPDVIAIAKEKRLSVDRQVAGFLAEVCAGDLHRVSSELEKLALVRDEADTSSVTLEQVERAAVGGGLLSGWEVADAVMARDRPAALAAARRLVDSGDEPIRIVGGLAWRARMLLRAKAMQERGRPTREVVEAVRAWRYKDRLIEGLKRYSLDELLAFPALLLDADRTLKSRSLSPRAVLEALVDRMTGKAAESQSMR